MRAGKGDKAAIKPLSLRKNFVWTSAGTVVSAAAQMAVLSIIAKLAGAEGQGAYQYAMGVCLPIYLFTGLSLVRVLVVDVDDSHSFGEYLGVRLFLNTVAFLLIVGFVVLRGHKDSMAWVLIGVGLWQYLLMITQLCQALFQKQECMNFLGISRVVTGFLSITGMAGGIWLTGSTVGGIFAVCGLTLLRLVLYDFRNVRRFTGIWPRFDFWLLKQMVAKCWVVSLASGLAAWTINMPRYILEHQLGTASVGYFGAVSCVTQGMLLVTVALVASALRQLSVSFQNDLSRFLRLLFRLVLITLGFGLANLLFSLVFGKYFLLWFFRPSYVEYWTAMCIFSVGGVFLGLVSILGDTIVSTRHYWWRAWASVGSLTVIYLSSGPLVAHYGITGISLACLLGFSAECLLCALSLTLIARRQRRNHELVQAEASVPVGEEVAL